MLVLVVAAVFFVAISAAAVTLGGYVIERAQAQTAADAAALGSLEGGRAAARHLADRHGATLVTFTREPGSGRVTVLVRVGGATATAAATDEP